MRSDSQSGNTCDQGDGEDLDEGGVGVLEVGESEIEVSEVGAVGVVLKLSGGSKFAWFGAVLYASDANPEVSVDTIAIFPCRLRNSTIRRRMDAEILSILVCGGAISNVTHMLELPEAEFIIFGEVILEGPGNIEVLSYIGVIYSVEGLRISTCASCAVSAGGTNREINNRSAYREIIAT